MTREIEVSRKVCSQIINVSSVAFLYISGSNIQQRILLSSLPAVSFPGLHLMLLLLLKKLCIMFNQDYFQSLWYTSTYLVGTWNTLLALLFLYTVVDLLHNANLPVFPENFFKKSGWKWKARKIIGTSSSVFDKNGCIFCKEKDKYT